MTKATRAIAMTKKVLSSDKIKPKWNTMSQLYLKRFVDNDPTLTQGAKRNRIANPYIVVAELDPSGRATCKLCGDIIKKDTVRVRFMLECHKGYRMPCTLHSICFDRHPEISKIKDVTEIHLSSNLSQEQRNDIVERFERSKTTVKSVVEEVNS